MHDPIPDPLAPDWPGEKPRPVLFASSYTGLGGGETSLLALAEYLDPARWTPHLLIRAEGQLADRWRAGGWPLHVMAWRPAFPLFVPALWARLPRVTALTVLLRQERFAAVHADYHSLPLLAPACRRAGIPWLWTAHGWWLRPRPWQRGLFRAANHTLAVSQAAKDGFLGSPPFMPPDRVEVLPLGVDTTRFHPEVEGAPLRAELGIPPDAPVIAIVGRFQPLKGHLHFLQMAARLAPDYPAARFLLVGDNVLDGAQGDRHKAAVLAAIQADPRLRAQVIFAGFRADTPQVMAATDVLVCASDFESFGMVHLEAMASGTALVSTNRGGPAEIVRDGKTGLLVPPGDPEALAAAVRRLLDDPRLRARLGQAGRAHVTARLDARHYAAGFEAALERVLAAE
ncbi:MAG: glycosyltransferase family 4 protein [Anaerolineae bacterium]|nr:glycosyltransferase family 4 protein [Anaerolineae bacterium]